MNEKIIAHISYSHRHDTIGTAQCRLCEWTEKPRPESHGRHEDTARDAVMRHLTEQHGVSATAGPEPNEKGDGLDFDKITSN